MVQFDEFLKTWSLRSNSVTRQVSFDRTKIGGKCQNSNFQKRHLELFSNNVVCFWHSLLQRFDIEVKLIWLLKLSLTVRVMLFVLGSLWTNSSESLMMMTLTYAATPCVVQDDADDSTTFSNTLFPSQIMSNELSNFQDFTTSGHLLLLLLKLLLLLQSRWFT